MRQINIMFCFNQNAWMQAAVCFSSLFHHAASECAYHIHIVHPGDINDETKAKLTALLKDSPESTMEFIAAPEEYLKDLQVDSPVQKIFLLRVISPLLFPNIKKIIYCDTDILFGKSLVEMDSIDMTGYLIGAVPDYWRPPENITAYYRYDVYSLFDKYRYFNAGIMILNFEEMRKQHITEKCLNLVKENKLLLYDQDSLNIVCRDQVRYLPVKYNRGAYYTTEFCEKCRAIQNQSVEELEDNLNNYTILHYVGHKPEGTKTIGLWHNTLWWEECAKLPEIYKAMRQKQQEEKRKEKVAKWKKKIKKVFQYIFKTKEKQSGKRNFYLFGIKVFSYKPYVEITAAEQQLLAEVQSEFPEIMGFSEMLTKIKQGASLARFGDAEFDIGLQKNKDDAYQKPSQELSDKLFDILKRPSSDKLLIAIPPFDAQHNNVACYYKNISFWKWYWMARWKGLKKFITQPRYANSFFSRDSIFYEVPVEELKSIWENKNVCFVVPKNGRFIYEDRLFGNIKNKSEIFVSATSAYDNYPDILAQCLSYPKDTLFFVCAGPTATVLVADLSDRGYQALDMGHFPNCYLEYLGEAKRPEAYPMKKEENA